MKFQSLTEESEYQYRIAASNIVGEGPFCEPCAPFTAKDPFGIFLNSSFKTHVLLLCFLVYQTNLESPGVPNMGKLKMAESR